MSDPMTQVEIEDVLSSIRRLVSDLAVDQGGASARPGAHQPRTALSVAHPPATAAAAQPPVATGALEAFDAPADRPDPEPPADAALDRPAEADFADAPEAADMPEAEAAHPDPLMLTPALRVAEADSASLRASLEETIAELEAAISGAGGDWEPDGSEMPSADFDPALAMPERPDGNAEPAPDPQDEGAAPEPQGLQATADNPAEDVAAPEAAEVPAVSVADMAGPSGLLRLVSDTGDARPEGLSSQYPESLEWASPGDLVADAPQGPAETAPEPGPDATEADEAPDADGAWAGFPAGGGEDHALAADPVPDAAADAGRAEAPDWQDDAARGDGARRLHLAGGLGWGAAAPISAAGRGWSPGDPAEADLLEAEEEEPGLFDDVEDAVLDEAALRALVSEIIRQELQGTLGERITRSVRKLVRREIQRALAARDFE